MFTSLFDYFLVVLTPCPLLVITTLVYILIPTSRADFPCRHEYPPWGPGKVFLGPGTFFLGPDTFFFS